MVSKILFLKKIAIKLIAVFYGLISVLAFSQVQSLGTPQAMKATTGIGLHKNRIWWVNWDLNNSKSPGDNLVNGAVTTFTSPAGFTYKVTVSNVKVYNSSGTEITTGSNYVFGSALSTSWTGNNFPTAYSSFPSAPVIALNNMLSTAGNGNRINFRLTVQATDPSGVIGNPAGIVVGGSESLGSTGEWYTLTVPQGKVRVIDKYIKDVNNWANFSVQLQVSNSGKTIKAINANGGDSRGDVILFAEDVPYIDAEVKGGGGQSIAIGFLEELDYSDAPSSYGRAFHLIENKLTGGIFADGNTNMTTVTNTADISSSTGQLAKFSDPTLRLGADIDPEDAPTLPAVGAAPSADDSSGADDEDALPTANALNGYLNIKYTNINQSNSYLTLWVDKDRNGVFDATEKITKNIIANISGTAVFNLNPLSIPAGNNYYTRIRFSTLNNLEPTGYAPDGEVEDHFINISNSVYNIIGNVYKDSDAAVPDGTGLGQVTVQLYDVNNNLIETTTTEFDGTYLFNNNNLGLNNGTYYVRLTAPAGYNHVSATDNTPLDGSTTVVIGNANVVNVNFGLNNQFCFKEPLQKTGGLESPMGITSLRRAGSHDEDNNSSNDWPMIRKGAWMVLESSKKSFIINRVVANSEITSDGQVPNSVIANPVRGMMVYDTTNNCLKIYTGTLWKCLSKPSCPTSN